MSKTKTILTIKHDWSSTTYLERNGKLYRRRENGGTQGAYDSRNFTPSCEQISADELDEAVLLWDVDEEYDAGERNLVVYG